MASNDKMEFGDIDEAEEEALLKSDDEPELTGIKQTVAELSDDDMQQEVDSEDVDSVEDEDDDDDEEQLLKRYKTMLKEIEDNPYVYDNYVKLCDFAHNTGDLDIIRTAYTKFSNVYPLTNNLWLKYLSVEISIAQSAAEILRVEQLFRTALKDYYSYEIAEEFGNFAAKCTNASEIWQELLGTYGLYILKGHQLFNKYRLYLIKMGNKKTSQAYIKSFLQELKYPLKDMEESYIEFKVLYEKNKTELSEQVNWENVDETYFKAKEHLQKVLKFEKELSELEANSYRERGNVYERYIKMADKFLDENVLQTIYERMVADCCLNVDAWLTYIDFISYRDAYGRPAELQQLPVFQQTAEQIVERALRNCTWSERLYIKRMLLMEQSDCTREQVQEVLESSLAAGFQTAEPAVAIWLEYLTYLRRQTDFNNEDECEILRKNFNLCWTILGQQWGVLADCNCEILQFWGRLEYGPLQDPKRGKELWSTVLESSDNSTKSGLWIEFAQLEIRRDLEGTRNLYRKALQVPDLDNPFVIASAWERFERCNGSIQTLNTCKRDCSSFLAQYQRKVRNPFNDAKKGIKRRASGEAISNELETKEPAPKRSKFSDRETSKMHNNMANEEHAHKEIDLAKDHLRIFLSNLDYNLTEEDIREQLSELNIVRVDLIRSPNGRSRGFGYLELKSEADVVKALEMDRRMLQGRPMYVSSVLRDKEKREKFKYSESMEPTKLFVKSLPQDTTQEEIETLFGAHGKLKDVRLVYHKSGKFKNIAYIEFENEASAGKALMATDRLELRGHIISVAISAPPPKVTAPNTPNITKLLGMSNKRNKNQSEQKPRIAFIPTAVRQKANADNKAMPPPSIPAAQASTSNGTTPSGKTNADFRKMLLK